MKTYNEFIAEASNPSAHFTKHATGYVTQVHKAAHRESSGNSNTESMWRKAHAHLAEIEKVHGRHAAEYVADNVGTHDDIQSAHEHVFGE